MASVQTHLELYSVLNLTKSHCEIKMYTETKQQTLVTIMIYIQHMHSYAHKRQQEDIMYKGTFHMHFPEHIYTYTHTQCAHTLTHTTCTHKCTQTKHTRKSTPTHLFKETISIALTENASPKMLLSIQCLVMRCHIPTTQDTMKTRMSLAVNSTEKSSTSDGEGG